MPRKKFISLSFSSHHVVRCAAVVAPIKACRTVCCKMNRAIWIQPSFIIQANQTEPWFRIFPTFHGNCFICHRPIVMQIAVKCGINQAVEMSYKTAGENKSLFWNFACQWTWWRINADLALLVIWQASSGPSRNDSFCQFVYHFEAKEWEWMRTWNSKDASGPKVLSGTWAVSLGWWSREAEAKCVLLDR